MLNFQSKSMSRVILLSLASTALGSEMNTNSHSETSEALKESFNLEKGTFTVETKWTTVQQTSSETDVLYGKVSFRAKPSSANTTCPNVSFIQTARILDNKGNDYQWPSGQSVRNRLRTKTGMQGVEHGYFIDHDAMLCGQESERCSPFFRDHWPNTDVGSQDGLLTDKKSKAAILIDFPYGWESITSAELETCAVCRETNVNFGCVTWGGTWPLTGERSLHPITSAEEPSATFSKALSLFNAHYNK
ncbi:MAG: hypothetical protein RIR26_1387 [Pseudomonadota bacterium]